MFSAKLILHLEVQMVFFSSNTENSSLGFWYQPSLFLWLFFLLYTFVLKELSLFYLQKKYILKQAVWSIDGLVV